jgi:hypothetical protein
MIKIVEGIGEKESQRGERSRGSEGDAKDR